MLIKRSIILFIVIMLFPVFQSQGAAPQTRTRFSPRAIAREPAVIKYGVDVSRWQEDIVWEDVAQSGIEFAMIRAGVGEFTDPQGEHHPISEDSRFREYIEGAQSNGLEVGVYFYSYAQTIEQIREEAHFYVLLLSYFHITYPVTLDMEESSDYYIDDPSEMAEAFLEIVEHEGYFPMLYSYKSWLEDNLSSEVRSKYTAWVAHIDVRATTYRGNYYMWQYSHTAKVSGIEGDVDLNIAYRDFAEYIKREKLNNLY